MLIAGYAQEVSSRRKDRRNRTHVDRSLTCCSGATENARHENAGPNCRGGNAGKVSMESQIVKKCLKVVVFVCRVIPSVYY